MASNNTSRTSKAPIQAKLLRVGHPRSGSWAGSAPDCGARPWLLPWLTLAAAALFTGCQTAGFYTQAARGQLEILRQQQPLDKVIADPQSPPPLKEQLQLVQRLRAFAKAELKLPVDGHYTKYVDLHRPYVVWSVQAAPEFSLEPKSWWYPLVGSLEYRGYFSERGARDCAARLAAQGADVCVEGVEAYSTLGWFKDPVLNTFAGHPEPQLAEILFHELAHQRLFAASDTDFNEAFATTVGQEGTRRWLRSQGKTNLCERYDLALRRNDQFVHLVMATRTRLEALYGDTRDTDGKLKAARPSFALPDVLRREKQRVIADLRRAYAELKSQWDGFDGYDEWFARDLNNARLNTIANYYDFVPGFERLLANSGGDWEKFYTAAQRLARLPKPERHQALRELAGENLHQPGRDNQP
jgi:predicted aminopeptidase